jgi:mannose-6-phosphate isomerase-like protein (cupin superfamily)
MMTPLAAESGLFDRELPHAVRHELFGGQGAVRVWALTAAPTLPFTAVLACELEPRGSVGAHVQEQYPEIVIAVSGNGKVWVNDVARAFGAGQVVELALGHTLAISNLSNTEPLRYLIIKAQPARSGA